jgi:hypothetical protein
VVRRREATSRDLAAEHRNERAIVLINRRPVLLGNPPNRITRRDSLAAGIYRIYRSIQSHIAILFRQVILAFEYRETDIPALKSDGIPWLLRLIRFER